MLIFQFLNDKIHTYVLFDTIVNFIIQKLKNKHTFLKKPQKVAKLSKAKFSRFEGTRGDKNQIFPTLEYSEIGKKMKNRETGPKFLNSIITVIYTCLTIHIL